MSVKKMPLAPIMAWRVAMFVLSASIALISYRYLTASPGRSPQVLANGFASPYLFLHVLGAASALLIGPFQFIARFRIRRSGVHRLLGRVYVVACLLGAAAGLPLALGSTAGPIAAAGFGSLAICWFVATALGWRYAVAGNIAAHRRWMLRSWAMTFAAVTLRLFLLTLPYTGMTFLEGYRFISWGCWLFNLAVLELWLAARSGGWWRGAAAAATAQ